MTNKTVKWVEEDSCICCARKVYRECGIVWKSLGEDFFVCKPCIDEMYNLTPDNKVTLTEIEASVDHLKKELESVLTNFVNTGIIPVADREQLEKFDKSF